VVDRVAVRLRVLEQIINDYDRLEPGDGDSWNPLTDDLQLGYRLGLFHALVHALRASGRESSSLTVVDLGCGNGRSTRMYLDLGFRPDQLTGLDLRPNSIALARRQNPAIRYEVLDGPRLPYADGSVSWLSLCTVLSSILGTASRAGLAAEVRRVLAPDGFLFYFDHIHANDFAGGDRIAPATLFHPLTVRWQRDVRMQEFLPDHVPGADEPARRQPWRWRLGRSPGLLSYIPRPHGLGRALRARLPAPLARARVRVPPLVEACLLQGS
jgi:SAM-dependent methyltransferase